MGNTFGRFTAKESKSKAVDTMRFVALSETIRLEAKRKIFAKSFKTYASDDEGSGSKVVDEESDKVKKGANSKTNSYEDDWSKNHYLSNDNSYNSSKGSGVIISWYHLDFLRQAEEISNTRPIVEVTKPGAPTQANGTEKELTTWLTFRRPATAPRRFEWEDPVPEEVSVLKKKHPDMFEGCEGPEGILSRMFELEPIGFLKYAENDAKECECVQAFLKFSVERMQASLYEKLHDIWQRAQINAQDGFGPDVSSESESVVELVMGFGHVRTYQEKDKTLVNGPLIDNVLRLRKLGDASIAIQPADDAKYTLNAQASDAIIMASGGNTEIVNELRRDVSDTKPATLVPALPDTYQSFLETARDLCCYGDVKDTNNRNVHAPPHTPNEMLLTNAWCLYARPKMTSAFSRDAELLANALEKRELEMPRAFYAVTDGSDALEKLHGHAGSQVQADQLILPLAASKQQRLVPEKLWVHNCPVVVLEGPPG